MLSGYGNYFSAKQNRAGVKWLCKRIAYIIVPFALSFFYLLIVRTLLFKQQASVLLVREFFTVTIPGMTAWYLKVQILMYAFVAIAMFICEKYPGTLLAILTFVYVCSSCLYASPDYWWKTAMCFPLGFIFAAYNERVLPALASRYTLCAAGVACVFALFWCRKCGNPPVILVLYHLLVASFVMSFLSQFRFWSRGLALLGKHSILIYLIHIGLAKLCFGTQNNIWLNAVLYISLTFAGVAICGMLSDAALNKVNILFCTKNK